MSQQIQSYGNNPYSEEALRLAEVGRGQEGMARTAAPVGPNLAIGGPLAQPQVNAQMFSNSVKMGQNMGQNQQTQVPGMQAANIGQLRKGVAEQSNAENKAQEFANERVATMLYANDGGNKTMAMGMPEVADRIDRDVATQTVMANGINPKTPFTSNRFAA